MIVGSDGLIALDARPGDRGAVSADLRTRTYAHLQRLSVEFFGGKRTGDLMARLSTDTDRIWIAIEETDTPPLIAAFDTGTGNLMGWNPNFLDEFNYTFLDEVDAIAVNATTVFAGGNFYRFGRADRGFLAAVDRAESLFLQGCARCQATCPVLWSGAAESRPRNGGAR